MNRDAILPKDELVKRLERFCRDPKRYFPVPLIAKECGYEYKQFLKIFKYRRHPVPDHLQIRASKVLGKMENGEYRLMQNGNGTQWLEHREVPRARLQAVAQVVLTPAGMRLQLGQRNRSDYRDQRGCFHDPA